jgi:predicted MFS family arabinose efflux permease
VGKPRNSAMAVYGAMSALGITIGVLLGGVLTGTLGWRWVFFINIPIGLAVLAGSGVLAEGERNAGRLDTPGATAGPARWSRSPTASPMPPSTAGATRSRSAPSARPVVLGLLFLRFQARGRTRCCRWASSGTATARGSYATMLFVGAGLMGTFYLLALHLQQVLGFGPLRAGIASLPFSAGIVLGAGVSSKLVERLAPRLVAGPGLLLGALGMLWLSALAVDSSYAAYVMPALFVTSFGLGMAAVTMTLTAVHGVAEDRAGVASASSTWRSRSGRRWGSPSSPPSPSRRRSGGCPTLPGPCRKVSSAATRRPSPGRPER